MAWIKTYSTSDAPQEVKEAYEQISSSRGKVSNILAVQSLDTKSMLRHLELYKSIMFAREGLSRMEKEMIAVAVSHLNECPYCIQHHEDALQHYWKHDVSVQEAMEDLEHASLPDRLKVMLSFAIVITGKPSRASEELIQALRDEGLTESEILSLAQVTSYFNFVNRMALGLGVATNKEELSGYKY